MRRNDCPRWTGICIQPAPNMSETAKAEHELHVIEATDELCKARLRKRNETMPEGLYFGHVSEDIFDPVTSLLALPSQAEGFNVVRHQAG
jgi:hypothetical protein